jgi:hypothetical protein
MSRLLYGIVVAGWGAIVISDDGGSGWPYGGSDLGAASAIAISNCERHTSERCRLDVALVVNDAALSVTNVVQSIAVQAA